MHSANGRREKQWWMRVQAVGADDALEVMHVAVMVMAIMKTEKRFVRARCGLISGVNMSAGAEYQKEERVGPHRDLEAGVLMLSR
jgi:hypothetical protein